MGGVDNNLVNEFISSMEDLMIGMQQVDVSCMEAYQDVSKREFALLVTMGKRESMIMREVADFLQIPVSTATGIIDKLIEKGYVIRDYSPIDRRIVIVKLSEEGKSIYLTMKDKLFTFGKCTLEFFSDEEKITLTKLLNKAAENTFLMKMGKS